VVNGKVKQTVKTNEQARYAFTHLRPGRYVVVARQTGYVPQRRMVRIIRARQVLGVYFTLAPWKGIPWSISGTVLQEDGRTPLVGATVTLLRQLSPLHSE
jgi:hypothetical protein